MLRWMFVFLGIHIIAKSCLVLDTSFSRLRWLLVGS